jgi:hypothetical protein
MRGHDQWSATYSNGFWILHASRHTRKISLLIIKHDTLASTIHQQAKHAHLIDQLSLNSYGYAKAQRPSRMSAKA